MTPRPPSTRRRAATCGCDPQLLGEINGKLTMVIDAQKEHGETVRAMDTRLRSVENRSAIAGAVGGMLMALGVQFTGWLLTKKG